MKKQATYNQRGFTLLELIITISLAVVILSVAVSAYDRFSDAAKLKSTVRHMAACIYAARNDALTTGVETAFTLDIANRTYRYQSNGDIYQIDPDIAIQTSTAAFAELPKGISQIRFAADGSSSGGKLTLADGRRQLVIAVDWLTGKVEIRV